MAKSHGSTYVQPRRGIAVSVGKNRRGHFVEVPKIDWLATVAEMHGEGAANVVLDAIVDLMAREAKIAANSADIVRDDDPDVEREAINEAVTAIAVGRYDSGDISGRDDFNRALLARAKETLVNALRSRGNLNPSDADVSKAFKANYKRAMELFADEVFASTYVPSVRVSGGASGKYEDVAGLI